MQDMTCVKDQKTKNGERKLNLHTITYNMYGDRETRSEL